MRGKDRQRNALLLAGGFAVLFVALLLFGSKLAALAILVVGLVGEYFFLRLTHPAGAARATYEILYKED